MKREQIYRKAALAIIAVLCFILPNASAQTMDKGLHLIDMDQHHNAAVFFKDLTKQAPTNADAWYYLGLCYSQIGNADSALIAFNAGFLADPKNPANISGQAMVQHLKNNDVQAKATFLVASKLNQKKYPNGLVSILQGYALCKYPVDEFIDGVYKKAQSNNVKNSNIYLKWGEILYNAKDYGAASLAYFRAISNDPKNILAHYLLGQMYNAARNSEAALVEIDAALEIDPNFVPAIREKAESFYALKKYDEAATWYDKYIKVTEETIPSLTRYAEVLFFDKKYEKAHEIITKILKIEPNNEVMLRLMGWISYELNKDTDGVNAMSKFFQLRKEPSANVFPKDYEYYAKLLMRTGQDSLAIVYFQKTLAVDSTNKREFIENIGDLFLKEKKYVESAQYLEKAQGFRTGISGQLQNKIGQNYKAAALLLIPSDSLQKKAFLANPGTTFTDLLEKADSAFSRVCQSNPNNVSGYIQRARLRNLLDPDASKGLAKPYYEKTLEVAQANKPEENKSIMLECLQYLASQAGNSFIEAQNAKDKVKSAQLKAEVLEILNKIVALDPTNKYAIDNIKLLSPAKKPAVKK